MASHLDLQEQEQIAQFKHFWNTHGQRISWALIFILGSYTAWMGWQYWQRSQATQAAALFDEVERAVQSRDMVRIERSAADMKARYGRTHQAHQAALLAAHSLQAAGKPEPAQAWLAWVAADAPNPALRDVARLRWAALVWQTQSPQEALQVLNGIDSPDMLPLADDLRGDLLQALSQPAQAVTAYQKAHAAMPSTSAYRSVVEAKLGALGIAVAAGVSEKARP